MDPSVHALPPPPPAVSLKNVVLESLHDCYCRRRHSAGSLKGCDVSFGRGLK